MTPDPEDVDPRELRSGPSLALGFFVSCRTFAKRTQLSVISSVLLRVRGADAVVLVLGKKLADRPLQPALNLLEYVAVY